MVKIWHLVASSLEFASFRHRRKERATSYQLPATKSGFSLVELLIIVSIVSIISSIVLADYNDLDSKMLLSSLAHDVALTVREAQTYGVSVREQDGSGDFEAGYGVYIDTDQPGQYVLFRDENSPKQEYDAGDVVVKTYRLSPGYEIAEICEKGVSPPSCHDQIHVVFTRPDPEPHIKSGAATLSNPIRMQIKSPKGSTRDVVVTLTGQISVEQ